MYQMVMIDDDTDLGRDEDELFVRVSEAEPEQLLGDVLPVDGVQEHVPLIQTSEGGLHHVPEGADEAHLGVALLAS